MTSAEGVPRQVFDAGISLPAILLSFGCDGEAGADIHAARPLRIASIAVYK